MKPNIALCWQELRETSALVPVFLAVTDPPGPLLAPITLYPESQVCGSLDFSPEPLLLSSDCRSSNEFILSCRFKNHLCVAVSQIHISKPDNSLGFHLTVTTLWCPNDTENSPPNDLNKRTFIGSTVTLKQK